jgi:hypothetical protein
VIIKKLSYLAVNNLVIDEQNIENYLEEFLSWADFSLMQRNSREFSDHLYDYLSVVRTIPNFEIEGINPYSDEYLGFRGLCRKDDKWKIKKILTACFDQKFTFQAVELIDLYVKIDQAEARKILADRQTQIVDILQYHIQKNEFDQFIKLLNIIQQIDPRLTKKIVNSPYSQDSQSDNTLLHDTKA